MQVCSIVGMARLRLDVRREPPLGDELPHDRFSVHVCLLSFSLALKVKNPLSLHFHHYIRLRCSRRAFDDDCCSNNEASIVIDGYEDLYLSTAPRKSTQPIMSSTAVRFVHSRTAGMSGELDCECLVVECHYSCGCQKRKICW